MKVYMHCLTNQDITHQFAYTQEIRKEFFDNANNNDSIELNGKKSQEKLTAAVLTATDCRLNNNFKILLSKEGNFSVGDIVIFYKTGFRKYDIELIKQTDEKYSIYKQLFTDERHLPLYINNIDENDSSKLNYTPFSAKDKIKSYNRIIFGAPGTGKSFRLNKEAKESNFAEITRVTFHPDYSYSQFVGTYKPTMVKNKSAITNENVSAMKEAASDKEEIAYKYVPGPFLRTLVAALKSIKNGNPQNYLLIIEEINRARVAAVFGDVFQLLDRNADGESEYEIQTSEDMRKFLAEPEQLGGNPDDYKTLKLPNNFYIWATMNSADQGVFPMDTAFKRRWNFEYIGINENESGVSSYKIPINKTTLVNWNHLRKAINNKLISCNVNEDKLLGPYFISENDLKNATQKPEDFIKLFKSKVIMYLFEDAAKMKRDFFKLTGKRKYIYSDVCGELDENGIAVFGFSEDEKGKLKEEIVGSSPTMTANTKLDSSALPQNDGSQKTVVSTGSTTAPTMTANTKVDSSASPRND